MPRISWLNESVEHIHRILCAEQRTPRTSWSYRSSSTVRLANLSGTHHHEVPLGDQENSGRYKYFSIGVSRKDHLHEHGQQHRLVDQAKRIKMLTERLRSQIMLEFSRIVVVVFSDREMKKSGMERATTSQKRTWNDIAYKMIKIIPIERRPDYQCSDHWNGVS